MTMRIGGILRTAGVLLAVLAAGSAAAVERGGEGGANWIGASEPGPGSPPGQFFIDDTGQGAIITVGYAFLPQFALRFTGGTAQHSTSRSDVSVYHSSGVLEAHYRFLPARRVRPYVFGGLGGTDLRADHEGFRVRTSGGVAVLGAGLLGNLTDHLLADLSFRADWINWNKVEVSQDLPDGSTAQLESPIEESGGAAKLLVGLLWEF
jgi:hypothetical protein